MTEKFIAITRAMQRIRRKSDTRNQTTPALTQHLHSPGIKYPYVYADATPHRSVILLTPATVLYEMT